MCLYKILSSKQHNEHYLIRYIRFIAWCNSLPIIDEISYENHHICPKAKDLFPEFSSFKENPWNKCRLTSRQHFIAHWMLWKAFGGSQTRAFWKFNHSKNHQQIASSKLYQKLKTEFGVNQSKLMKNKKKTINHANKLKKHLLSKTNTNEQKQRAKLRMTGRFVSPEEREKIAIGVSKHVSQTWWITDGVLSKRILQSDSIPIGWKRGRVGWANKLKP